MRSLSLFVVCFFLGCSQSAAPTKVDPNNGIEVNRLIEDGLTLASNGATDSAITQFKKALELDPSNVRAKRRLRDSYGTKNELATAEDYAGQLITQGDTDIENYSVIMVKGIRLKNIETLRRSAGGYLKNGGDEQYVKQCFTRFYYSPTMFHELDADQLANIEKEVASLRK
jgi:tetratricopeptide (TPR) repeat protein